MTKLLMDYDNNKIRFGKSSDLIINERSSSKMKPRFLAFTGVKTRSDFRKKLLFESNKKKFSSFEL